MAQLSLDGLKRKRGRRKKGEGGDLTHCVLCLRELTRYERSKKSTICKSCSDILRERWEYNAPVERPVFSTPMHAYVHLFMAIRKQAEADGELEDFNRFWMVHDGIYQAFRELMGLMQWEHGVHFSESLNQDGCHAIR